jgi:energy-coupling factor transporter ATP-binding protein EcfA2
MGGAGNFYQLHGVFSMDSMTFLQGKLSHYPPISGGPAPSLAAANCQHSSSGLRTFLVLCVYLDSLAPAPFCTIQRALHPWPIAVTSEGMAIPRGIGLALPSKKSLNTTMEIENADLKLSRLALERFTAFGALELDFSPGINVIIGENSTGKTHLMKLLFSVLEGISEGGRPTAGHASQREQAVYSKLMETFKPNTLGRLANRGGAGRRRASVALSASLGGESLPLCQFEFNTNSQKLDFQALHEQSQPISSLYIPPVEMLTLSEGFIAAYRNRETAYDYTYYALAAALDAQPARGPREEMAQRLMAPISNALNIHVHRKDGRFYIRFRGSRAGEIEAPLVAEGLKKMGQLVYLITNGSLAKNSILFWDEPEAHLNPKYIEIVAMLLQTLASHGVQIFVSTHDYLLSQRLSALAEHRTEQTPPMQFIGLYYDGEAGTSAVETAPTLLGLQKNPILEEFARYAEEDAMRAWEDAL